MSYILDWYNRDYLPGLHGTSMEARVALTALIKDLSGRIDKAAMDFIEWERVSVVDAKQMLIVVSRFDDPAKWKAFAKKEVARKDSYLYKSLVDEDNSLSIPPHFNNLSESHPVSEALSLALNGTRYELSKKYSDPPKVKAVIDLLPSFEAGVKYSAFREWITLVLSRICNEEWKKSGD